MALGLMLQESQEQCEEDVAEVWAAKTEFKSVSLIVKCFIVFFNEVREDLK